MCKDPPIKRWVEEVFPADGGGSRTVKSSILLIKRREMLTIDDLNVLSRFYVVLANPHRLDDFICMKLGKDKPGQVYDLLHFVQAFYKSNIDNNNTKTQN